LARQACFDELESEDTEDVLVSHTEELTNKDLQQLTEYMESADVEELLKSHCEDLSTEGLQKLVAAGEIEDAEDEEVQDAKPRELPTSVLSSILREVDKQLQILEDNDYNAERSRIAVRGVKYFLAPYEQLLCERRKTAKQQTLDVFISQPPRSRLKTLNHSHPLLELDVFFVPTMQPKLHLMMMILMMTMTTVK
ncbi:hypothetical protein Hamer_G005748, partial [Homarus americanus]